ncbi:hypothetical protein QJQ45_005061 [Haematococcus lacustris]|nr:hypothetical protein QJQ45_005061 [Haematococcus lacustris]
MNLGPDTAFPASSFVGYYWNIQRSACSNLTSLCATTYALVDYLAYWYARYLSPISSISASAQWLAGNSGLNVSISTFLLAPSDNPDTIVTVVKRVSNFDVVNQTFVPDSVQYPLLPHVQRTGIMDWGVDPFTPTPLAAPVCRPDELASGLGYTQAQPYVMQNCNMRVVNNTASNSTNTSLVSPVGLSGSPAPSPPPQPPGPGSSPFLALIPAGTAIWWQGHALRSFAADLAGQASAVVLGANSQLSIRNLTLLNTGTQVVDPAAVAAGSVTPHPLQLFSMALWAIGNVSSDTSMVLDMVTIVIPPEELAILHLFASGQRNCGCSLSSATQATLARMFDTSLVSAITNTSLSFGRVRAERWSGTRVTLSSDPSSTPFTLLPNSPLSDVKVVTSSAGSKHSVDLRWVVPVAVLGGLAVLAGLLAAVWVYRRRRDLQTQPSTAVKLFDMQEEGGILGTMPSSPRVNGSLGNQLGPATSMPHEQTHYKHSGSPPLDASDPSLNKYLVSTAQSVDAEWACKLDDPDVAAKAAELIAGYTPGNHPHITQRPIPEEEEEGEAAEAAEAAEGAGAADKAWLVQPVAVPGIGLEIVTDHGVQGSTGPSSIQLQGSSMSHSKSWHGAGGRSWGMSSGASRQNEESSMGMVSDSFDRPGSEYGEWRPMASTESDQLLQEVRSDVGAGGKLVISGVLGAGAHAVVYKGEWRGRPVAVKCLLFQEHRVHTKRQALQEAAINTRLAHPNIVNTYTFELRAIGANAEGLPSSTGKTSQAHQKDGHMSIAEDQAVAGDWKMYIVQEYCDGGHLKRAVDSGALTEDGVTPSMLTVVNTALDIACGLQHIHSKNIIHGDLSPANILLKLDDSRLGCLKAIAKVGDFGLSHMSKDGQSHVSNVRQGTPHYTAPEVRTPGYEVLMEGRMTRAADVYSFGVILHELYCGQPAWRRRNRGGGALVHAVAVEARNSTHTHSGTPPRTDNSSSSAPDSGTGSGSGSCGRSGALRGAGLQQHALSSAMAQADASTTTDSSTPNPPSTVSQQSRESMDCHTAGQAKHTDLAQPPPSTLATTHSQPLPAAAAAAAAAAASPTPAPTVLHNPVITQATMRALQRYAMAPDQFHSCPLPFPEACPHWYARLAAACMASQPELRPKLFDVVKLLLVQQRELMKAAASKPTPSRLPLPWSLSEGLSKVDE